MSVPTRQLTCLRLAAQGLTTTQTAKNLNIHQSTVKADLSDIRARLGARNTAHAVAIAAAIGLITANTNQNIPIALALGRIAQALGYDLALTPREDA